jgi:N-acetylneuraminic acid mutarotase
MKSATLTPSRLDGAGRAVKRSNRYVAPPAVVKNTAHAFTLPMALVGLLTALALPPVAQAQTWSVRQPIPTPVDVAASAVLNGELYVVGGQYQFYGYITNKHASFNPATNTWTNRASAPASRYGAGAAVASGQLFLIGGRAESPVASVSTVYSYNPATNSWTTRAPLLQARDTFATAEVNGIIYVIGGDINQHVVDTIIRDVEAYNPILDEWTPRAPLPSPRAGAAVATVGTRIFVIGGTGTGGVRLDSMLEFETTTGVWTARHSLPAHRSNAQAVTVNGQVYAIGGADDSGLVPTIDIYDPLSDSWSTGVSLPSARADVSAGAVGNTIVVAAGLAISGGSVVLSSETDTFTVPAQSQGLVGPAGPAGPQGPAGIAGPVGPQGPKGDTGAVGPQGPAGPQGATGASGAQGATGATGAQGSTGPSGPTGPAGPAGPQGPIGTGLVSGSLLHLLDGVQPPAGYDYVGSYTLELKNQNGGRATNAHTEAHVYRKQ